MNRLIVIFAWLLILGAGHLVQAAQTVAVTDATSHRSFAALSRTSITAYTQPADCFFAVDWVLPNDDISSGNNQPNADSVSTPPTFDCGEWPRFLGSSSLFFDQLAGSGQPTPLFVLFHAWKILPPQ